MGRSDICKVNRLGKVITHLDLESGSERCIALKDASFSACYSLGGVKLGGKVWGGDVTSQKNAVWNAFLQVHFVPSGYLYTLISKSPSSPQGKNNCQPPIMSEKQERYTHRLNPFWWHGVILLSLILILLSKQRVCSCSICVCVNQLISVKLVMMVKMLGCNEPSCVTPGYSVIPLGQGFSKHPPNTQPAWQLLDDFVCLSWITAPFIILLNIHGRHI